MAQFGWIKLHRKIQECELWLDDEPFSKRDAWIDLLLMANHEAKKVVLGNQLIEVLPGQRVTSQAQLADRWHWSRQKVRSYLKLLEQLGQITTSVTNKYTVINIVKYGTYQLLECSEQPTYNQQTTNNETSTEHQKDTNNNDKELLRMNNNTTTTINTNYISKSDAGGFNVCQEVEKALMLPLSQTLAELFVALYDEVGEAAFREALIESAKYGGRSYAYVEAVARNIASGGSKPKGLGAIDWDKV